MDAAFMLHWQQFDADVAIFQLGKAHSGINFTACFSSCLRMRQSGRMDPN
jgi:hypothetical protein